MAKSNAIKPRSEILRSHFSLLVNTRKPYLL